MGPELLPIVYGLASAACWGGGDFCGGMATKRVNIYSVMVISQFTGMVLLAVLAILLNDFMPSSEYLISGALGGLCGGVGLMLLYRALATGRMGIAAPISAVVGAIVPVVFGAFLEGLPTLLQMVGFGFGIVAVWLISRSDKAKIRPNDIVQPAIAGAILGLFAIFINQASDGGSILWPLVVARAASMLLMFSALRYYGQSLQPERGVFSLIVLNGLLDTGGNAFFALAAQTGRLDIAAVMSALYPAVTVLLAWLILHERISRLQTMGVVAALMAIVLIAL